MSLKNIKVIAFDADDTLWVNETFFRAAEEEFCDESGNADAHFLSLHYGPRVETALRAPRREIW